MIVRPYEAADAPAGRGLWVDLTEWHRSIYAAPDIGGDDPGARFDEHLATVGAENLWVAEIDDEVVGLAGLIERGTEAEVEPVVVAPSHRRTGIGRALLVTLVAAARARGLRSLSVRPVARNEPALAFFHALGFTTMGHVELFMTFPPRSRSPGPMVGGTRFDV